MNMGTTPSRSRLSAFLLATASLGVLILGPAWFLRPVDAAQAAKTSQAAGRPAGENGHGKVPRTPWGHPDLQGAWTNATTTPLERPAQFAGKERLTDEERQALDARAAQGADRKPRAGDTGAYNSFWLDNGTALNQTSLIVDPPDGRLPPLTPDAKKREEALEIARRQPAGSWEDLNLFERCLTRGMPGAMMPGFYNHNYQILQTPTYVAFQVEMSGYRIVPIDGRAHVSSTILQWLGDSRGRWDGDTLVVETTNLTDRVHERRRSNTVFGGSGQTTMVERFTRVDADTIDYRFTVTDPATFTRPWTASIPMRKIDSPIFEYGCHEANYSLPNILRGARLEEREKAAGESR
jgi:hypothetical protein